MNKKVLIFGSTGGIGSQIKNILCLKKYEIICPTKNEIDFNSIDSIILIENIIKKYNPDIIINCSGILGDNDTDYDSIFNINLKSNWNILNYYKKNPTDKIVKIIMIGSSAYKSGRRDYILYAASKAALFNMFEGASEYFESKKIILGLINPSKVDTKMISHLINNKSTNITNPIDVANYIIDFFENMIKSNYINIK